MFGLKFHLVPTLLRGNVSLTLSVTKKSLSGVSGFQKDHITIEMGIRCSFFAFKAVLDGEVAVPCCPQSAIAGLNSHP